MKKLLLASLLGLGLLLPSTNAIAKESAKHRKLDIGIEGYVLLANAEKSDGPIRKMEVRQMSDGKLMITQESYSYSSSVDISSLPKGYYVVKVFAEETSYSEQFVK